MNTKKKSKIWIIVLVLFIFCLFIGDIYYSLRDKYADYTNSIYVMTSNPNNGKNKINYYEINNNKNIRNINEFVSDDYYSINLIDCLESYIDSEKNKVLNKLNENTCHIVDGEKNRNINYSELKDETLKNIIIEISKLEHNKFMEKIYKTRSNYYVIVNNNVNMWDPYNLYYYDMERNELRLIYKFDGEDIIGIKEKEPFIFYEGGKK